MERVTDAFCVSAESKAVMGASMADPQQRECIGCAKHLASFAGQGTAPVTSIQIENHRFAHFLHACSSLVPIGDENSEVPPRS